jgi:hypothetical protein
MRIGSSFKPAEALQPLHDGDSPTGGGEQFLGFVRAIRAEAQNIKICLAEIRKVAGIADKGARERAVRAAFAGQSKIFDNNRGQIHGLLNRLEELVENEPRLYARTSDEVVHIGNFWERAEQAWPGQELPADELLQRIAALEKQLDDLIFHAGLVTIPPRVDEHLDDLRVGDVLDFHSNFDDELPDAGERRKILDFLAGHPRSVRGVVDAKNGVIYRASDRRSRQALSYVLILGVAALGAVLPWVLSRFGAWFNLSDWPIGPERMVELYRVYLFLLGGALVHTGVDALKARKSMPVGQALMWIHVKETPIMGGVGLVVVCLIGLAFTTQGIDWKTAALVGYSVDSFAELFLRRFTAAVSAQTEVLTKQLG